MAQLIYAMIASLDGYVADERGDFAWARPDAEVHAFFNDLERPIGTYLYGRRMYETMRYWETAPDTAETPEVLADYGRIWRASDKIVFSRTLAEADTTRTELERDFDPDAVRRLKESAESDLSVGGPRLAAAALKAGLVDECHLVLAPAIVGGGNRALPDGLRAALRLLSERRFEGGFVHLHYAVEG